MQIRIKNLIDSLDKLHTTKMGEDRIRKNLGLSTNYDVVEFCKNAIKNADLTVFQGKNWYAYGGGNVINCQCKKPYNYNGTFATTKQQKQAKSKVTAFVLTDLKK